MSADVHDRQVPKTIAAGAELYASISFTLGLVKPFVAHLELGRWHYNCCKSVAQRLTAVLGSIEQTSLAEALTLISSACLISSAQSESG
jgi:hypothetical protein